MKNITIGGIKLKTLLLWLFISLFLFISVCIFWNKFLINAPYNSITLTLAIVAVILGAFSFLFLVALLGIIIFGIIAEKNYKKENNISFEVVKDKLTTQYTEVKLLNESHPFTIYAENIKCMAKLDEDNNIVYKVQIEFEEASDNYRLFTNYFEV